MLSSIRCTGFGVLSKSGMSLLSASTSFTAGSSLSSPAAFPATLDLVRTATKKAGGVVVNKSDSAGRHLGVKRFGDEEVTVSNIIVRQRGTKYHPGLNVYMGKDHTLHAGVDGSVKFSRAYIAGRKRVRKWRTYVSVIPAGQTDQVRFSFLTSSQISQFRCDIFAMLDGTLLKL